MPVFPKAVIMGRHAHYKFPVKKITKIGFDHGLYQFKRWTSPKNYNSFDLYLVSSESQVKKAESLGIYSTKAVGYPKLDSAFNGDITDEDLEAIKMKSGINQNKKTIIFTSTWDTDGLSALNRWINKVHTLTEKYNILLTAHTWTAKSKLDKLRKIKNAYFIEDFNITRYLMISDVFIGDYNSLIGEFCAFNKPIITFNVPESERTIPEVIELIRSISIQINNFDEIEPAISHCLNNPNEKSAERKKANDVLFYKLDGRAGERAAKVIKSLLLSSSKN